MSLGGGRGLWCDRPHAARPAARSAMIALPNGDLCVADRLYSRLQVVSRDGEHVEPCRARGSAARLAPAVHHTVRGTYGAPKLENAYGARTAVRYAPVELPCASGTHGTAAAPYGYPPGPPCAPGTCGTAMPHRHVCLGRTLLLYVRHSTGHMPYQPGPPCASGTCGTAAALHWPHAPINPGLAPCPPSRK